MALRFVEEQPSRCALGVSEEAFQMLLVYALNLWYNPVYQLLILLFGLVK